jgi:hypothetical protein
LKTKKGNKMKMEITVSGCPYEDRETLSTFANSLDLNYAIFKAKEFIRSRLKYNDIESNEEFFLHELLELLTINIEISE